jgi:hypothetical protein
LKEKLRLEFNEIKDTYNRAYEKARNSSKIDLQVTLSLIDQKTFAFAFHVYLIA